MGSLTNEGPGLACDDQSEASVVSVLVLTCDADTALVPIAGAAHGDWSEPSNTDNP